MAQTQYAVSGSGAGSDAWSTQYLQTAAGAVGTVCFGIAPVACTLNKIEVSWGVAAGAASTLDITKDPSLTAAGAGTSVLAAPFDANTTADTSASIALAASGVTLAFAAGDKISIKVATGTATATAKLIVNAYFIKI